MKILDLENQVKKLSKDASLLEVISRIEFYRGATYSLPKRIKLNRLHDISKRRSVTSSNEIEGIKVSKKDENKIFVDKFEPDTIEEKQLLGYNDALENIFKQYKYHELDSSFISHLHQMVWGRVSSEYGGRYKDHQNYIREYYSDGTSRTIFIPVKPVDTPQIMDNLIYQFNLCVNKPTVNKLLLLCVFIVDFLCIHPFGDGNGRVSRLLATFLLLKNNYELDYYYSTSYLILKKLDEYYDALEKSSIGWYEDENNYSWFASYLLNVILDGYKKLNYILSVNNEKLLLIDKVKKIVYESNEPISKAEIEEVLFINKRDSIEEALGKLIKDNTIKLIQRGKYSLYYR